MDQPKTAARKLMNFRVDADVDQEVRDRADRDGVTVSDVVREALASYLNGQRVSA